MQIKEKENKISLNFEWEIFSSMKLGKEIDKKVDFCTKKVVQINLACIICWNNSEAIKISSSLCKL